jgi:hypothetical protein
MDKNRGIKTWQLDDGIGDTFILAFELLGGGTTRDSPGAQYQGIANTIVQLIRRTTSRVIASSFPCTERACVLFAQYLKKGW